MLTIKLLFFISVGLLTMWKIKFANITYFIDALRYAFSKKNKSVLFTQDTGPTDRIWEIAKNYKNLVAIFTEVSFPNNMQKVATASLHHTPSTLKTEIKKMPKNIPIFLGHLKPNFQEQLFQEVDQIGLDRLVCLGSSNHSYLF